MPVHGSFAVNTRQTTGAGQVTRVPTLRHRRRPPAPSGSHGHAHSAVHTRADAAATRHPTSTCSATASTEPAPGSAPHPPPADDAPPQHHALILDAVRDPESMNHITLRGKVGPKQPWRQVTVRPVMLKQVLHLQFSQFTQKQNIVRNLLPGDAAAALADLLQLPWSFAAVATAGQQVNMQITKRGKAIVQGGAAAVPPAGQTTPTGPIDLSHDRQKDLPMPPTRRDPFLREIGLQTEDGRVRAGMQAKFTQVCVCLCMHAPPAGERAPRFSGLLALPPTCSPCNPHLMPWSTCADGL
jgi:hypothetical protein